MDALQEPAPLTPNSHQWDEDLVFKILGNPRRRELLAALVRESSQPASKIGTEHQLESTLKHLGIMRKAGFVTMGANPVDGRRALYSLSPAISALVSECKSVFHFDFPSFRAEVSIRASSSPTTHQWSENLVFSTLTEPLRRKVFLALARRGPQSVDNLRGVTGRNLDDTLKRLVSLRSSGWVTMSDNSKDGRRNLYSLTPKVPLTTDGKGKVIDFGFCVLRLG